MKHPAHATRFIRQYFWVNGEPYHGALAAKRATYGLETGMVVVRHSSPDGRHVYAEELDSMALAEMRAVFCEYPKLDGSERTMCLWCEEHIITRDRYCPLCGYPRGPLISREIISGPRGETTVLVVPNDVPGATLSRSPYGAHEHCDRDRHYAHVIDVGPGSRSWPVHVGVDMAYVPEGGA